MIAFARTHTAVRALIRMIWIIIYDTIPFLTVFLAFVFSFTFAYQVLHDVMFVTAFINIYQLAYGEFYDVEDTDQDRTLFLFASLILPMLLLNMIVALMGDVYSKTAEKRVIEDTRERLLLINKYQRFAIFGRSKDPELKYLHGIQDAYKEYNTKEFTHKKLSDLKSSMHHMHNEFIRK